MYVRTVTLIRTEHAYRYSYIYMQVLFSFIITYVLIGSLIRHNLLLVIPISVSTPVFLELAA